MHHRVAFPLMPKRSSQREPTREDLQEAEREIGKNIPKEMIGEDDGDVGDVKPDA